MTFGDNLRQLRIQRKFSQQQVADDLEMSQSSIASYENSSRIPPIEVVQKIADYFNVSPVMLIPFKKESRDEEVIRIADTIYYNPKLIHLFDTIKNFDDKSLDVLMTVASSLSEK